ncbi:cold shock domain-containing protein [Nocardia testacea]|uniref:cold shock domain-containing protein n=1 Tax=Nocardia testacea TaxID=248551 RepID=UPI003C2E8A95
MESGHGRLESERPVTAPVSPRLEEESGAALSRPAAERPSVRRGRVIWYDAQKGFGYIDPDDDIAPVFVEYRSIDADGYRVLFADQRVEFSTVARAGGAEAVGVRLCE